MRCALCRVRRHSTAWSRSSSWRPRRWWWAAATTPTPAPARRGRGVRRRLPDALLVVEDAGEAPLAWRGAQLSRAIAGFLDQEIAPRRRAARPAHDRRALRSGHPVVLGRAHRQSLEPVLGRQLGESGEVAAAVLCALRERRHRHQAAHRDRAAVEEARRAPPGRSRPCPPPPATFTWTSTSSAGCFSSCRSAESEATEWIRRTFGATSRTLRLWSAPMKSQLNRSRWSSCLASRSWARFSPTSSIPASASAGSSPAGHVLDRGADLHRRPDPLAAPSRGCSGRRAESRPLNSSATQHQARLASRHPARRGGGRRTGRRGRRCSRSTCSIALHSPPARARARRPPAGRASGPAPTPSMSRELGAHLVAHLVAAAPDAGPDRGRRRLVEARRARWPTIPPASPRQPQCSIATRAVAASATGCSRPPAPAGRAAARRVTCPSTRASSVARRRVRRSRGRSHSRQRPCRAPASPSPSPRGRGRSLAPAGARFSRDAIGRVVGEDAEVERRVGTVADPAQAGGEVGAPARQVDRVDHRAPWIARLELLVAAGDLAVQLAAQRPRPGRGRPRDPAHPGLEQVVRRRSRAAPG